MGVIVGEGHTHHSLPQTGITYSGFYSSNQVGISRWMSVGGVGGCQWIVSVGGY